MNTFQKIAVFLLSLGLFTGIVYAKEYFGTQDFTSATTTVAAPVADTQAATKKYVDDNGGFTNLTDFINQTAWRVFYSNTAGDVTELALGADGTYLRSNGAAAAPTFATPAGSGDVSKVGTPVDNQVGVWTGDGTIEGAASLTYDGANLQLTGDIGSTGTKITKGWFTDLMATNAIAGSITGNAATCTTASAGDAAVDFFGAGVDAVTDATTCTNIEGTGLAITTSVLNWSASGIAGHDSFSDFVANEHLDWTSDLGATNIHAGNYTDTNTTYTAGTGLTLGGGAFSVNTSQNIATLSNLTNNGFVKTSGGAGTLSVDTSSYQPLDTGLTNLSGLAWVSDSFIKFTATDTFAVRTLAETKTDLSLNNVSNVAIDDTAYNATSWDSNSDGATKNSIRDKIETMLTAIGLNTAKDTNVSTALSVGTVGANTVAITSDGGADDVTLPAATVSAAGMLTTAKWGEVVANNAKNTNVSTALSAGTVNATTYAITSDGGADDIVLPEADTTNAGLLGSDKWDEIVANTSKVTNATHTGDATGATALTVVKINGVSMAGLATGILKNTTSTGAPSIAVAGDFPTLNQNTSGSAATLTTTRAIYGNNFDGSAALTQIIASTYGGTGNGFTKFAGATTAEKTYTLPDANATLLYSGGNAGTPSALVGTNISGTAASFNIGGTASNLSGTPALPDGTTATTQSASDNSTKLATTAYADAAGGAPEGTAVLSTGEGGGTKYLREDGDGTSSWQTIAGGGDVSKVGTPANDQVGVWTGDGTIEGTSGLTYTGSLLGISGNISLSGTNNIIGANAMDIYTTGTGDDILIDANSGGAANINIGVSGDSDLINLYGTVTADGTVNATTFVGALTGEAATVATITGLAPDTATTQATQASITTCANLATVGTIATGVWEGTDVGFAHGGTGISSWTQYLIPYAATTTSIGQIAIGTDGQYLTSAGAGVAPAFETLDIVSDTSPDLGGELDAGAHSIGFTMQTATGDGTTTINWGLGNKFKFTFGAQNDTFTFTAPTNPCSIQLILVQDGTGSRTATWPATVKWAGGTAPTLTTTAAGIDIVSCIWDSTNYFCTASMAFATPA